MSTHVAVALGFALALLPACERAAPERTAPEVPPAAVAAEPPGASLYPLQPALVGDDGAALRLDAFRGHPVLISMFYGTCPVACPLLISRVQKVDRELPPEVRADTRVLLVSFDPARDTPAALRAVRARHGVDDPRWKLATGPADDVRDLAAALEITYRQTADGGFAHTSVLLALDADGHVVARAEGPDADLGVLVRGLTRAHQQAARAR